MKNETIINSFRKIAKVNSQHDNQSVLITKISFRKTQKIANLHKYTPAKISRFTVLLSVK